MAESFPGFDTPPERSQAGPPEDLTQIFTAAQKTARSEYQLNKSSLNFNKAETPLYPMQKGLFNSN
jgi:hypothetical protein